MSPSGSVLAVSREQVRSSLPAVAGSGEMLTTGVVGALLYTVVDEEVLVALSSVPSLAVATT